MANTTTSPNMNLPIPVVGVDPGPDWANNINASLGIIDSHNHSTGQGVPINPTGMNINSDLTFQSNNGTNFRSVRFTPQSSVLTNAADIGCLYESGVDLYYNDGAGNNVRITQSGSVTGSSGTITGLPSGTASAAYSAGTFTFQSATSTPAALSVGPVTIGPQTASPNEITLNAAASMPANYGLTFPAAAPTGSQTLSSDSSGNLSWAAFASGSFSPTVTAVTGTLSSSGNFVYLRVGNVVTFSGRLGCVTNGSGFIEMTITIPISVSSNFTSAGQLNGGVGYTGGNNVGECIIFSSSGSQSAEIIFTNSTGSAIVNLSFQAQYLVY